MLTQSQGLCNVLTNEEKEKVPNYYCSKVVTNCGEFVTVILLPPSFVRQIAKCVQASRLKVTEIGLFVTFFLLILKKNLNWVQ